MNGSGSEKVIPSPLARHLSEAAFWMLRRQEPYKDPARQAVTLGKGQRDANMVKVKP